MSKTQTAKIEKAMRDAWVRGIERWIVEGEPNAKQRELEHVQAPCGLLAAPPEALKAWRRRR